MSQAPERIWAWSMTPEWKTAWDVDDAEAPPHAAPYIRADLVEAAVKRAIEACAREAEKLSECCQSCAGVGREVRAIATDPEAIAKIIGGGE